MVIINGMALVETLMDAVRVAEPLALVLKFEGKKLLSCFLCLIDCLFYWHCYIHIAFCADEIFCYNCLPY